MYFLNKITFLLTVISSFLLFSHQGYSQLDVSNTPQSTNGSPSWLVQNVLLGNGITATDIRFNYDGFGNGDSSLQIGYFDGASSNIGLPRGIILSTGDVNNAVGPNDDSGIANGTETATAGDADLDMISALSTQDAAVLEFDFVPIGDSVIFKYVFASEEYNEYVCNIYNDVFGFFISGPGYSGPYSNGAENIALIPGTSTPVAINSVNDGFANSPSPDPNPTDPCTTNDGDNCPCNSSYFVNNEYPVQGSSVQYDGFTVALTAKALVQCGETYHIKMAIADVGDGFYDSGVLLEAESFYSPPLLVDVSTYAGGGNIVEGCSEASFTFTRTKDFNDSLIVHFTLGGNAINGVDYTNLDTTVIFEPGETTQDVTLLPIADGVTEGVDTITVEVLNITPCGDTIPQTANIYIHDEHYVVAEINDTSTCEGTSVNVTASATGGEGDYTYVWSNGSTNNPATLAPAATDSFYVTATDSTGCFGVDSMQVTVFELPDADAGPDVTICNGDTTMIGGSPTGPLNSTYSWSPNADIDDPTIANPNVFPASNTFYTVTVEDTNGCIASDQMEITVSNSISVEAGSGQDICSGETVQIGGSPTGPASADFLWAPAASLDDSSLANPTASPVTSTLYHVTVTSNSGCTGIDSVQMNVNPLPFATAEKDTSICPGDSVTITATGGASYLWSPATGLSSTSISSPEASPASGTTYFVTITDNNSCSATDSVTIDVFPAPIAEAGEDSTICAGDTTSLLASGGIAYAWTPASGLNNSAIDNPNAFPADSTTYTVEVTDANGCTATDSVNVFVNGLPNADAGDNQWICPGDSATLNATGGSSYSWSPTTGLADPNNNSTKASPADTTEYVVTVTDINSCVNTDTIVVEVNTIVPTNAGEDTSICFGDSLQIGGSPTAPAGTEYQWTPNFALSDDTAANPVCFTTTDTTFVVETTNHVCNGSDTISISVYSLPAIDAGNNSEICIGDTVQLSASGGIGFTWSPPSSLDNPSLQNPLAFPVDTTLYTVEVTDTNGCKNSDSVAVNVNPLPSVSTSPDTTICSGDTLSILANGGQSYQWSPVNFINDPNLQNPDVFPPDTIKYTVTVTDSNACVNYDSVTVNTYSLPVVTVSEDTAICNGDSIQINASGGVNYNWMPTTDIISSNSPDPVVFPSSTTTYSVEVTDTNTCSSTGAVTIQVYQLPSVDAGANDQVCIGNTIQLNATGAEGYIWLPSGTLNDDTIANPVATPIDTTMYYVTGTDTNTCQNTDSVLVSVNPLPVVDPGADTSICKYTSAQIGGNMTGPVSSNYNWSPGIDMNDSTLANPTVLNAGQTQTYHVLVTDTNNCQASDSVVVAVFHVTANNGDTSVCENNAINLTVEAKDGRPSYEYLWQPTTSLSDSTSSTVSASPDEPISYTIVVTDALNCRDTAFINVEVYSPPEAIFNFDLQPSCDGAYVTFENTSINADSYLWTFNSNDTTSEENPEFIFPYNDELNVVLIAENENNCSDTASYSESTLSFEDYYDLEMPSVFTPNNDGINDFMELDFSNKLQECTEMTIYNRWGQLVFHSTGNYHSWDGSTFTGKIAAEGIYYIVININGIEVKKSITLLR